MSEAWMAIELSWINYQHKHLHHIWFFAKKKNHTYVLKTVRRENSNDSQGAFWYETSNHWDWNSSYYVAGTSKGQPKPYFTFCRDMSTLYQLTLKFWVTLRWIHHLWHSVWFAFDLLFPLRNGDWGLCVLLKKWVPNIYLCIITYNHLHLILYKN